MVNFCRPNIIILIETLQLHTDLTVLTELSTHILHKIDSKIEVIDQLQLHPKGNQAKGRREKHRKIRNF